MIIPLGTEPGEPGFQRMPRWYGVAWEDPLQLAVHAFPIPVNLFVRWWLGAYRWARWSRGNTFERLLWEAERRGRERGRREGQEAHRAAGYEAGRRDEAILTRGIIADFMAERIGR